MKYAKILAVVVVGMFMVSALGMAHAEDNPGTIKEELAADKAAIKAQKDEMKTSAQAARAEEKQLKEGIREARQSGDAAKAKELKGQLKATHKENVAQMRSDKKDMRSAKKELRQDYRATRKASRGPGPNPK